MSPHELRQLLLAEIHSEAALAFINTRLILRTGVNLNDGDFALEPHRLEAALREIRAMGYLKEKGR
jgi:hypothetical protein